MGNIIDHPVMVFDPQGITEQLHAERRSEAQYVFVFGNMQITDYLKVTNKNIKNS